MHACLGWPLQVYAYVQVLSLAILYHKGLMIGNYQYLIQVGAHQSYTHRSGHMLDQGTPHLSLFYPPHTPLPGPHSS